MFAYTRCFYLQETFLVTSLPQTIHVNFAQNNSKGKIVFRFDGNENRVRQTDKNPCP
jgi:nitrous oxidase accessory protein NosD